jgi:O-antigen/teichoic acid export membrane protein
LVLLTAGLLWVLPFVSLLEGCGQIAVVNRYRVYQALSTNLVVWTCIVLGAGLWTAAAASAARLAWDLILILARYGRFYRTLVQSSGGPPLHWRTDLWPMQWRLAISGVFSYFAFALFTPLMFHYHGPSVAGQMGMTWQLMVILQAVALAWVQARVPLFGRLIAKGDLKERDRVFFRLTWISLLVVSAGAALLWLAVWGLYYFDIRLATRMLAPLPTALFLLAIVLFHFPNCQALYIRAHKRELLLPTSVVSSVLIGGSAWWFGKHYGPLGAACGYLCVVAFVILPWQTRIWWRCRTTVQK